MATKNTKRHKNGIRIGVGSPENAEQTRFPCSSLFVTFCGHAWPPRHNSATSNLARRVGGLKGLSESVNLLGIEDLIVALEEPGNGGAVDLHFPPANAKCPVAGNVI